MRMNFNKNHDGFSRRRHLEFAIYRKSARNEDDRLYNCTNNTKNGCKFCYIAKLIFLWDNVIITYK